MRVDMAESYRVFTCKIWLVEIINMGHVGSFIFSFKRYRRSGPISIAIAAAPPVGRAGPSA